MIISNIIGGLGNQMFQYAVGRAISLKLHVPLKLDTRDFSAYQLHQGFELDRLFNCNAEIATNNDLTHLLSWQKAKLAQKLLRKPQLKSFRLKNLVVEPDFNYWSGINQLEGNKYLYGYWQSEKYFIELAENIREDFTFKLPLSDKNLEITELISQVNAVSLHVRRGDYVANTNTANTHGVCSLAYYRNAIRFIAEKVKHPYFFMFSDDIEWVKNNLEVSFPHIYVSHNVGVESYNDMRIMSMCMHHIIANSSFSWWGAWLNTNPNKIVISPEKWFAKSVDTSDLIPKSWIKL